MPIPAVHLLFTFRQVLGQIGAFQLDPKNHSKNKPS